MSNDLSTRQKLVLEAKLLAVGAMYCARRSDLPLKPYLAVLKKGMRKLWQTGIDAFYHECKATLETRAVDISNTLTLSSDPQDPIVIVVVKNDLKRMKLFFRHYRAIGVHQFAVLDNGSTDGTREFCASQPDTLVIRVDNPYLTIRKDGWVEHTINRLGTNRWYIAMDSDEMLDYPGSETHTVQELIRAQQAMGNERLYAYFVDMYDRAPIYETECEAEDIPHVFSWFDTESYHLGPGLYGTRMIFGGPRSRMTNEKNWAGKCPVYLYRDETTVIQSHFQHPFVDRTETNLCTVIRHYKFMREDRKKYASAAKKDSGYSPVSVSIYSRMNDLARKDAATMWYEKSAQYESSESLRKLPGLYPTFDK